MTGDEIAHDRHWPDSDATFRHTHRYARPHGHRQLRWGPVPRREPGGHT